MEKIKRLEILVSIVSNRAYISKKELLDYFFDYHDLDLSPRTLERDFKLLETDFHISISYDRSRNGYVLKDEDEHQISAFLEFAGRVYLADLFRRGFKVFRDLQQSIKLEDHSGFEGINNIEPTFLAIRQKRNISFIHENYINQTKKHYTIAPLQIREYQGRWYVVGVPMEADGKTTSSDNHIRTFGLARITHLKVAQPFNISSKDYEEQLNLFAQIVGLNYDESQNRELIEVATTPEQFKYFQSLPIHPSQRKTGYLPDGRITFCLHLIPNYELRMQLLQYGDKVEILQPAYLRMQIKKMLQNTLRQYDQ